LRDSQRSILLSGSECILRRGVLLPHVVVFNLLLSDAHAILPECRRGGILGLLSLLRVVGAHGIGTAWGASKIDASRGTSLSRQ